MSDLNDRFKRSISSKKTEDYWRDVNQQAENKRFLDDLIAKYKRTKAEVVDKLYSNYIEAINLEKKSLKKAFIEEIDKKITKKYNGHSWAISIPRNKIRSIIRSGLYELMPPDHNVDIFNIEGYPDFRKNIEQLLPALEVNIVNSIIIEISLDLRDFQLHMERRFFYGKELSKKQIQDFIGDKSFGVEGETKNSQELTKYDKKYVYDDESRISLISSTHVMPINIWDTSQSNPKQDMLGLLTSFPDKIEHKKKNIKSFFPKKLDISNNILMIDQNSIGEIERDQKELNKKEASRSKEVKKIQAVNKKIRTFFDDYTEFKTFNFPTDNGGSIRSHFYVLETVNGDEYTIMGKENSFIVQKIKNPILGSRKSVKVGTFDIDGLAEYFT